MKAVILAGGKGTRISEESQFRPKPMVEIGGRPILWHIMKIYSAAGINDFVILLGYRGSMIKEYFANYFLHSADVTIDMERNEVSTLRSNCEPWRVTLVDTGLDTMTGGRLLRAREYIGNDTFCLTYGDGLADIDLKEVIDFHENSGSTVTVTAVQPPGRFGMLDISDSYASFKEKPRGSAGWVNGGFLVASPKILDYIDGDRTALENEPLERLSAEGQLTAFEHHGFWKCMDTVWDKQVLTELWDTGTPPWKRWD
jgi:glucose-1-phosphate cytidylyltransferase